MSGSRWVITPLWLSGSLRPISHSSSVYSCHLFLISSASVRAIQVLSFTAPIFVWNVPLLSVIFLKTSLVFPTLFSSISWHGSVMRAFFSLLAILWHSAFRWVYLSFSTLLLQLILFYRKQSDTLRFFACVLAGGQESFHQNTKVVSVWYSQHRYNAWCK